MNSLLAEVTVWLMGLWALLMIVQAIYELLQWLTGALIMSVKWLAHKAWQCFTHFLIWLLGQLRKRVSKAFGSWLAWWPVVYRASMTNMKLVWLYLRKGRNDFDGFAGFKNDWNEFKQNQDSHQSGAKDFQDPTSSAYAQALEVLGLADQPDFTLADLKNQLRKMRAIVHPDKGFPNRVFIQQLNEAFAIVKNERNWL